MEKLYKNENWLKQKYYIEKLSQREIAEFCNVNTTTIELQFKKFGLKGRTKKYNINEDLINDESDFMWYFLGLWCADGWYSKNSKTYNIQLALKSGGGRDLVKEIKNSFQYEGPVNEYISATGLCITNQKLANWMIEKGVIVKNKTFNLDMSQIVFKTDKQLKLFVRGVFDGDGNIKYKFREDGIVVVTAIRILSASKKFSPLLVDLVKKQLNIEVFLKGSTYYSMEIYKQEDCLKFLNWIYDKDLPRLRLRSKYTLFRIIKMMI